MKKTTIPKYQYWLSLNEWALDVAIYLIAGEEPPIYVQNNEDKIYKTDTRTYKLATTAIQNGELPIVQKYDNKEGALYSVSPREFLEWATKNDIFISPHLMRYVNYSYWIDKTDSYFHLGVNGRGWGLDDFTWTIDEAVTIICAKKCPFPHEIKNVFECEETLSLAKKVLEIMRIDDLEDCHYDVVFACDDKIIKVDFLRWCEKQGFVIPIELERYCVAAEKQIENLNAEEPRKLGKEDCVLYSSLDSWEIDDAIALLMDRCPNQIMGKLSYKVGVEHYKIKKILLSSYVAGKVKLIKDESIPFTKKDNCVWVDFDQGRCFAGHIKPQEFIKWANEKGYEFPPLLMEIMGYNNSNDLPVTNVIALPEYTTPYIELMKQAIVELKITKENQPKVETELVPWFEERLKKIEGKDKVNNKAKLMATFVRLPEAQIGGNKPSKNKG